MEEAACKICNEWKFVIFKEATVNTREFQMLQGEITTEGNLTFIPGIISAGIYTCF